ncbi:hypothetical protein UFOVP412_37 [uncultured Caudovirales phage]|uniref:Uncharacterized protein n=1 Tax=uncultured Caudovirales phage TaxID=2100421 RepID=A0A6J5M4M1_9CAUD|nr:hypothetical protein UFOVP412_37 [uncultured Caudovirales phage]
MIIDLDGRQIEVEDGDIQSFLMMVNPPQPDGAEVVADRMDAAIQRLTEGLRNVLLTLKQDPVPPVVVDMTEPLANLADGIKQMKPKEPKPVKTIVVTDIERGRDGLIVSCNLEVKR